MADYPEWVMAHKAKGTYINKVGDKYYLYAAHSERVKGTDKVRRVCDGYLGRITEKDGLIAPRRRVKSTPRVYEYGLCISILGISKSMYSGFRRSFKDNGDFVFISSLLQFIFGDTGKLLFQSSYLCILFPDADLDKVASSVQKTGIERGVRMIETTLLNAWGDEYKSLCTLLRTIHMVGVEDAFYRSAIPEGLRLRLLEHNIELEVPSWLK